MGYRSDVVAVFYTQDPNEFPSIKLFIDENIPEWCRGDEFMSTFVGNHDIRGIKFTMSDVKWYPSYPDVKGFEDALDKFEKLSDGGDKWMWEFVRIGEETQDVEERWGDHSHNLLHVSRTIESDV
jgi:hypothetical protein